MKTYIQPMVKVTEIQVVRMMALSKGDVYNSSDVTYSREDNAWGEWDED